MSECKVGLGAVQLRILDRDQRIRAAAYDSLAARPALAMLCPVEYVSRPPRPPLHGLSADAGGGVGYASGVIAAGAGAVAIGDLSVAAGVSSTHLPQRFEEVVGVTPKRLARTY